MKTLFNNGWKFKKTDVEMSFDKVTEDGWARVEM